MPSNPYDFRQFQAELAALDGAGPTAPAKPAAPAKPVGKKAAEAERRARVREEFLALRQRHHLSVADVVAFFPEEEGIAYLQALLAAAEQKPRRRKIATSKPSVQSMERQATRLLDPSTDSA